MHIDAQHRSSIYQKLLPILGDDDANALMTAFPSLEADELVTRGHLRAELAELRAEMAGMRGEMAAMETRLTVRLGGAIAAQTTLMFAGFALLT